MTVLEIVFVNLGMLFFFISLGNYSEIMRIVHKEKVLLYWRITFGLTLFFMLGYVFKIYELMTFPETSDIMVSLVYMFGALFVLIITSLSVQTLKGFAKKTK